MPRLLYKDAIGKIIVVLYSNLTRPKCAVDRSENFAALIRAHTIINYYCHCLFLGKYIRYPPRNAASTYSMVNIDHD